MGKFGRTLGQKMLSMGDEVTIVDKSEDAINAVASKYTNAFIANCMNLDSLRAMDVPSYDACIVSIGEDFQASPDRDIAEKLAVRLNSENVINYIDIDAEYSIFEIACPVKWAGKRLADVNPRKKLGMNILTVKKANTVVSTLDGDYVFETGDQLVVFGNTETILSFTNKTK